MMKKHLKLKKLLNEKAVKITVSAIKGGCGKSTTTAITCWILSKLGFKVLAIDGDPQGNLTEAYFLESVRDLRLRGVDGIFQAVKESDPEKYIETLTDNLDVLIGEEIFGMFPDWLYLDYDYKSKSQHIVIRDRIIAPLESKYDFIIIDTAPSLGSTLTNFLIASDFVLGVFEASKFSYSSMLTLNEAIELLQKNSKTYDVNVEFIGILCSMIDPRRTDNKDFIDLIKTHQDFKNICFDKVITRKAATARLSFAGFFDNSEVNAAIMQYNPVIDEMLSRIESKLVTKKTLVSTDPKNPASNTDSNLTAFASDMIKFSSDMNKKELCNNVIKATKNK